MVNHINENDFDKSVLDNNKLCVVDFFATWCMPCKMLSPVIEEISNNYEDVSFYKIDIDENQDLTSKYNVQSVPTLLFIKNGEVVSQETGFRTKEELKEIVDKIK